MRADHVAFGADAKELGLTESRLYLGSVFSARTLSKLTVECLETAYIVALPAVQADGDRREGM